VGCIRLTFHTNAPLERVAALYRDVGRVLEWQYDILEVKDVSGPLGELLDRLLLRRAFARTVGEYNESFRPCRGAVCAPRAGVPAPVRCAWRNGLARTREEREAGAVEREREPQAHLQRHKCERGAQQRRLRVPYRPER